MNDIKFGMSRSGLHTIAESGGGMSRTGNALVICGAKGEMLRPIYKPERGIAMQPHAIFAVRDGMYAIKQWYSSVGYATEIYRLSVGQDGPAAVLVEKLGVSDPVESAPDFLQPAIKAARAKCRAYHCRSAFYAL